MNLLHLLDDDKCFEVIRAHRWPEGVRCPHCHMNQITEQGRDERQHVSRSLTTRPGRCLRAITNHCGSGLPGCT